MGAAERKPNVKNRRRGALLASTSLIAALAASTAGAQQVLPTQGSVASGAATIHQSGPAMTIQQTSPRAVINWNSFSIGAGDSVAFAQPNAASATLNRVTSATPSTIAGQLSATGQVYLVNPNGIAITPSGTVNVGGGFVASTLNIHDRDFNNGNLKFSGGGASAAVSNAGAIAVAPGGFVGLLGGSVANSGAIVAPLGKVALGSGERATLDLSGDGFLQVALPTNAETADGKALVDVSGKVKAAGGIVAIKAATAANAVRNAINLSGVASARSARAVGGSIVLGGGDGGAVKVAGALDASGRKGGGSISATGRDVALRNAKLTVRSGTGKGGAVAATATRTVRLVATEIDASGATGGGSIAVGGGHAASVAASALRADALASGDGGAITILSGGATSATGRLYARGGALSGAGGTVETSGETAHLGGAHVDTTAAHGATGNWLIDPTDFTIAASGGDITGAALSAELATTNVTILSSLGATGTAGDINVNDNVAWASATTLTLDAAANINVNANVDAQGGGGILFDAAANIIVNANITMTGGAATLIYGDTSQSGVGSNTAGVLTFPISDVGSAASLSFSGAGGVLTINGAGYTLLRSAGDFALMSATPAGNFAFATDITPATNYQTSVVPDFYGRLEGLGHTLNDLNVPGVSANLGFFGILDSAANNPAAPAGSVGTVSNLFLANANVGNIGATNVGALVANNFGHVYNSGSSGTVLGLGSATGGLVGNNFNYVEQGWSSANVNGANNTGGLVGFNTGGVIGGLASGKVEGADFVGGVVGQSNGYVNSGSANFVSGDNAVGGVVGQNNANSGNFSFQGGPALGPNGTVAGAFGFGQVFGTTTAGGVVGVNAGVVSDSFFTGEVSGDLTNGLSTGGLVGQNNGAINNSYALGPVSGVTNVGGLVGLNQGVIDSSFAMGATRGTTNVGGLVGSEGGTSLTTHIADSYSTGAVTGTGGVGGLVGAVTGGGDDSITNSFWDTLTSGQAASAGGVGHTTAELQGGLSLPMAGFLGGSAGGEANVYPFLTDLSGTQVRAISGFAFRPGGLLASTAAGPGLVFGDFGTGNGDQGTIQNPSTTGANGYYYIFTDPANLPAGRSTVVYTEANTASGASNAATYFEAAGVANQTVNILASTLTETTALPTYSQLVAATNAATGGDGNAPGALNGVTAINITYSGPDFRIDQAISAPGAALALIGANTTLAANVTANGVLFSGPVALAATTTVTPGAAGAVFGGAITGAAAGAGLTVNGPVQLDGNVTTNNGPLAFNGPVAVDANVTINSGTAATAFGSTIDSTGDSFSNNFGLTANAGALTFGGAIGGQFALGAVGLISTASMTLPSITSVSTFARTTGAGASLTLAPGTVLTASGFGNSVTLAAAGAFINDAGANAINLTGFASGSAPNWLIYSADPAADTFGGLDSNNQAIWNTPYPATTTPTGGDFYLFAFQPTVTFTSINDAKTYGQDVTARVATDFTVTGLQPGVAGAYLADTPARAYFGAPTVTSAGSPATANVVGSPYAIDVAQGSLVALNGYASALASPGLLTVAPEAITITAAANAKPYDSTTAAANAPTVTTGALFDAATLTETYATPNAGTGLTLTPQIAFATAAAAAANNYVVTLASAATGTITPAAITITAAANTKTYDSTTTAATAPTVTAGTLFDPATLSETYATSNAGNGLTLNPQVLFANAAAASNYAITLAPVATGVINPEPITITATPNTKIFDGDTSAAALPTLTAGTLFDPATLSETYASPGPASGIVLSPAIAFANPGAAGNYLVTLVPTGRTAPNTGIILSRAINIINYSPSVFTDPRPTLDIPGANATCGPDVQLPDPAAFADPVAAVQAISAATEHYVERCRDASQQDIANALDRYADALQVIIEKLPPKLRQQLRQIPAVVHMAAARARVAPTRVAAVRVLRQVVAQVRREIMLVRAEDPDSVRIRNAVSTGVSGVLNSAAVSLARAEGI